MPKVFIIVLNFNGREDTLECLESLAKLRVKDYELKTVVVDNGSTDGSVEAIRKFKEASLIENKNNLGFAEGNNVGIRFALDEGANFILVLNNDTVVDKNLVVELLKAARVHKKAGILGPKIYFASGFEYHQSRYKEKDLGKVIWCAGGKIDWANLLFSHRGVDEVDAGQYDEAEETDFVSGCAMLVRREVFERVGLFEKKYFAYLEDTDLCLRAKKEGFQLLYVPTAFLWHKVARTSGGIGSPIHDYYLTRNRLLFGWRYASLRTKLALFRESLRLLLAGREKRRAVLDFYLGRWGKGSS